MKNQSATYQPRSQQRKDWSSEVKIPSGSARAPSGTGIGGMEREAQSSGDWLYGTSDTRPGDALSVADSVSGAQGSLEGRRTNSAAGYGTRDTMHERESQNAMREREEEHPSGAGTWEHQSGTGGREDQNGMGDWEGQNGMGDYGSLSETEQQEFDDRAREREDMREEYEDGFTTGPRVVNGQEMRQIWPNIENNLSNEVVEAPTTMEEVYRGSMKALLLRNVGNYVVATFLIGTQTTVSWEGILYDVGNDYLAIYQSGRDQYIVSDLYSLKYVEFYDTRRRELCDSLLTAQRPDGNTQRP